MITNTTPMMTVTIARLGSDNASVSIAEGSTVAEVLAQASITLSTADTAYVSGVRAPLDAILEDGDVLSIVTQKVAGA